VPTALDNGIRRRALVCTRVVASVLATTLALPACGGDDAEKARPLTKSEYREEMRTTATILRELEFGLEEPSLIRADAETIDRRADELAALRPPQDIEAEHERAVSALRDAASAQQDLADAVEAGDDWHPAFAYTIRAIENFENALRAMDRKGYNVFEFFASSARRGPEEHRGSTTVASAGSPSGGPSSFT
jgi:hypothetical protein